MNGKTTGQVYQTLIVQKIIEEDKVTVGHVCNVILKQLLEQVQEQEQVLDKY